MSAPRAAGIPPFAPPRNLPHAAALGRLPPCAGGAAITISDRATFLSTSGQAALTGLIRSVEGRVGERQTERREREGGAAVSGVAAVAAEVARKAAGCVAWAAAAP